MGESDNSLKSTSSFNIGITSIELIAPSFELKYSLNSLVLTIYDGCARSDDDVRP